jgi:hypothetical protein
LTQLERQPNKNGGRPQKKMKNEDDLKKNENEDNLKKKWGKNEDNINKNEVDLKKK